MTSKRLEIWGPRDPNISAQFALAVRMDSFKKEAGLEVSYRLFESGTMIAPEILKTQRKPMAFMQTPISAMLLNDQDYNTKVVAPLASISGTQQLIVHPNSGIRHPKDLEGKRIGLAQGAAIYLAVRNMAHDYDVDLHQIEFVNLLPYEQVVAFGEGKIDAMACWEPWTTRAKNIGGYMLFSGARSEVPDMEGDVNWLVNQGCLIVSDEELAKHQQEVIAILKILRKSTDLINNHRQQVAKELAGFFDMSKQELIVAMRKNLYSMRFDNLFRIGLLGFRDFLSREKLISKNFSEQELYDTTLLRQIDPALVAIEKTVSQDVSVVEKPNIYYRQDLKLIDNKLDSRFLVVDDSKMVRSLLAQTIEIIGGKILGEATTGQEAIEKFSSLRPNFVTMDISMPGMSGIDAIKEILRQDPKVNIIVISGINNKELREETFDLGVKIFIAKPFDPILMAEIIGLLLL